MVGFDKKYVERVAALIRKELGIEYTENNFFQLQKRLETICKKIGTSVEDFQKMPPESMDLKVKSLLLDISTNNETSFFRDTSLFNAIREEVIPSLAPAGKFTEVNIWSCACSTGQEPYSLAMLLEQHLTKPEVNFKYRIYASDYSDRVLEQAKSGLFNHIEVQRGLPVTLLLKYFKKKEDGTWAIDQKLNDKISYHQLNLLGPFIGVGQFDLIMIRNVLIYQSPENKKLILEKVKSHLKPGGILILGASESMIGISDKFKMKQVGSTTVYIHKEDDLVAAA